MIKTLEGIVLSIRDYREADSILSVYCEHVGVQSFVARGLRKVNSKNAGSTQIYTYARFQVDFHDQKTMHMMRTADIVESFRRIREDLTKQSIAAILCECMGKVVFDDPSEGFELLKESLMYLQMTSQPYALASLFLSMMNRREGIEPYVEGCVHCGSASGIDSISIAQGGFLCEHCKKDKQTFIYNKDALKCFRLVCKAEIKHFNILETYQDWNYEHFMMVYRFFEEYSGISLRSIRFLACLQNL